MGSLVGVVWIRRVRTASGATAVQIAESVNGRRRIVRHVGSARDEGELALLLEQAQRLVDGDAQRELDLGLTPKAAKAVMIGPASSTLPIEKPGRAARQLVPRPRVLKTASALLYDVLAGVYADLGFDALGDEVFRDLVIARVVEPTSLLDVDRVLADLGRVAASHSTRKRTLRRACAGGYRERIAEACFAHARVAGDVSLVLYDVTTLYFEAEKEDLLRKVGYSKERRVDPQIVVGLLVDRTGFPLEIGCFEGSTAETRTIVPIIEQYRQRHDLAGTDMIVAADAGMLSVGNLTALDEAGLKFIVGSRQVKAPGDLASHFHWHGDRFTDGQIIDTVTPRRAGTVVNTRKVRAEPVWTTSNDTAWRAVWHYSSARARRDTVTLNAQEARAQAAVDGSKPTKSTRFVKTVGSARTLDVKSLARARSLVGLKGYVTNIESTVLGGSEVLGKYHDLWHVEQSFRMSKTDLAARPMFARTRDAIEAHLTIVFAALAVSRTVQDRTGLSIRRFLRTLRPLRSAIIELNGTATAFPPALTPDIEAVLADVRTAEPRH